jgi:hypothetical protein
MDGSSDDKLVTKFLLCGGVLWSTTNDKRSVKLHYAIKPGYNEYSTGEGVFASGASYGEAIREYIKKYGAPWETPPE